MICFKIAFIFLCIFWIFVFYKYPLENSFKGKKFKDIDFSGVLVIITLSICMYFIMCVGIWVIEGIIRREYHKQYPCENCRFVQISQTYLDKNGKEVTDTEVKWHHCNKLKNF